MVCVPVVSVPIDNSSAVSALVEMATGRMYATLLRMSRWSRKNCCCDGGVPPSEMTITMSLTVVRSPLAPVKT